MRLYALAFAALVAASAFAQTNFKIEVYAVGFSSPIAMIQDPTNPDVQFVVEQRGRIRPVVDGVVQATDFLNLTGTVHPSNSEGGLLGLAFHPNYAANRFFYVSYTDTSGDTRIVRYTRNAANPLLADPGTNQQVLFIDQPFSNHNGGTIAFGPNDGYLYLGFGDGGSANDPGNRAQTITNMLLGKMLRIDVNGDDFPADPSKNYAVPSTNPFVGVTGDDEIWSYGLRNPWKWSFDPPSLLGTGGILIGDVGQGAWEEVSYEPPSRPGRNYGWRVFEGNANTGLGGGTGPFIAPIHAYDRNAGFSITGGYVYRGLLLGDYFGRYFFADYGTRRVWSVAMTYNAITGEATASDLQDHTTDLNAGTGGISSFATDAQGELYIVDYRSGGQGRILKIVPENRAWLVSVVPDQQTPLNGSVRSLSAADGKKLIASQLESPIFPRMFQSKFFVNLATDMATTSQFDVFIDLNASASIGSSTLKIFARNWGTDQLVEIGSFAVTTTPTTLQILNVSAGNYVRSGDGAIQLYFDSLNPGAFASSRLTIDYDRVKIVVR